MNDFHRFFLEYMGADEKALHSGERVFHSAVRTSPETPFDFNRHHLIVAEYNGMLIHSIARELISGYISSAPQQTSDKLLEQVDDAFFSVNRGRYYRIREMFRYTVNHGYEEEPQVTILTPEHREMIFATSGRRGADVQEWLWQKNVLPLVKEGRRLAVIRDGKIVASSNVIDLPFSAANIDVWTHKDHRRKGYGSMCVKQAVNWCIKNDRIPVYLVHTTNERSVNLADSLGFQRMSREIQTVITRFR